MMKLVTFFLAILLASAGQVHAQGYCKRCGRGARGKAVIKYVDGQCIQMCSYTRTIPAGYKCGSCITDECYTAAGNATKQYDICMKLNMDPSIKDLFLTSRAKWTSIITTDIEDYTSEGAKETACGKYPAKIDDLFICGSVAILSDDFLGFGTILYDRADNGLPVIGEMKFNSKYLDDKVVLQDTITHEMGHVLGIGSRWFDRGLAGPNESECYYYGENANREYKAISGCSQLPLEMDGGPATKCAHWDEECFGDEMMSGYGAEPNTSEPLSRVTVGALADLGYAVNYNFADTYTSANLNPTCLCTASLSKGRISAPKSKPKLSKKGLEKATQFGQEILSRNIMKHGTSNTKSANSKLVFAGTKVEVIYKENGRIHYVDVTL